MISNLPLSSWLRPSARLCSLLLTGWFAFAVTVTAAAGNPPVGAPVLTRLTTPFLELAIDPSSGQYTLQDRQTGVSWKSNPFKARFGEVSLKVAGQNRTVDLAKCEVDALPQSLTLRFRPVADDPSRWLYIRVRALGEGRTLEFSYEVSAGLEVGSLRLLDEALGSTDRDEASVLIPCREGLMIPSNSGRFFQHRFDTYAYEGCHMAMAGVLKGGAALLLSWSDPYLAIEVRSATPPTPSFRCDQLLTTSVVLTKSARQVRLQFLGKGDHVDVAKAYRREAQAAGWWVDFASKIKAQPDRAKLVGAINYKLWSVLDRRMNEDSSKEESVRVNWTFDEAAEVAEHLKKDLRLDKVLFTMGGWIKRGYDNQHPDVLPAAPECGGDEKFAACAKRVMDLGYLLCLHDNYQDIYRDSPSWDEQYITKQRDGSLAKGGHWAGGVAYLTCSRRAVDLAMRPQNLPAVRKLTQANAYFIDTTYAAGLMECFDPQHPLTRSDDMYWKQVLSDRAREVFGVFGSECGREWAIPHSDFFEGLTGVSGGPYHDANLMEKVGGTVVPLFEIVYRDTIAMCGKYGYDVFQSADYVLSHLLLGRTLNHHNIPAHLYWKEKAAEDAPLRMRPALAEAKVVGARQVRLTYRWTVEAKPKTNWNVFVHFVDAAGKICAQGDYPPPTPTSSWTPGELVHGPFDVTLPDDVNEPLELRMGLFDPAANHRAVLAGLATKQRACLIGRAEFVKGQVRVQAVAASSTVPSGGDPGLFARGDFGWSERLHPVDRFVKNTAEVLSPLNELTALLPMEEHSFLTPDRKVQRVVFGSGTSAVTVVVNRGSTEFACDTKSGGRVVLPPYGFLVEAREFFAFHARVWNGIDYADPPLFTVRSLDGRPVGESRELRVFHGFGDDRIHLGSVDFLVPRETVLTSRGKL